MLCAQFSSQVCCFFLPEEGMVFHADFPEPFGRTMIWKFETNRAFKLLELQVRQNAVVSITMEIPLTTTIN